MQIKARAYAKINWVLEILNVRSDGYHELDMLMQSISLHDALAFEESSELTLLTDGQIDPYGEKNLIVRAARLLQRETGCKKGARIELTKRIPAMAGLGGGSADCAVTLLALNRLWRLELKEDRLLEMGFQLGADVPFCLRGGFMRVGGRGEKLRRLPAPPPVELLLAMTDDGLSTRAVFEEYDRGARIRPSVDVETVVAHMLRGDYASVDRYARNVLTEPAARVNGTVEQAIRAMYENGAVMARMSGSGSAVFGAFENVRDLRRAEAALKERFAFCEHVRTTPLGVEMEESV